MKDDRKLRITPRARAIYAQLKATKDDTERAHLECALHAAVGLYPWNYVPISEIVAELEKHHEPPRRKRV